MKQKSVLLISLLAAAAVQTGCVKDEDDIRGGEGRMQLVVESKVSEDKAMVRGTSVNWNPSGETLLVNGIKYSVSVTSDGKTAEVDVDPSATGYKCVYPATYFNSSYHSYDNVDIYGSNSSTPVAYKAHETSANYQFNYPKVYVSYMQTVGNAEWQTIEMPMLGVAQPGDGKIKLRHITGSVFVQISNQLDVPFVVDSVIVISSNRRLSGRIEVKQDGSAVYNSRTESNIAQRQVAVVFPQGKVIAAKAGYSNSTSVEVPVPPVGSTTLTIRISGRMQSPIGLTVDNLRMSYERQATNFSIAVNKQKRARATITMASSNSHSGYLTHKIPYFTVNNSGKKVAFSKGNLVHIFQDSYGECSRFGNKNTQYVEDMPTNNYSTDYAGNYYRPLIPYSKLAELRQEYTLLSEDELIYLCNTRTTSSGKRYLAATLNIGTKQYKGYILFPDNFAMPSGISIGGTQTYNAPSNYTATIGSAAWTALENAGCVFLQAQGYASAQSAAGLEYPGTRSGYNSVGCYWFNTGSSYRCFSGSNIYTSYYTRTESGTDRDRWASARNVQVVQQ